MCWSDSPLDAHQGDVTSRLYIKSTDEVTKRKRLSLINVAGLNILDDFLILVCFSFGLASYHLSNINSKNTFA